MSLLLDKTVASGPSGFDDLFGAARGAKKVFYQADPLGPDATLRNAAGVVLDQALSLYVLLDRSGSVAQKDYDYQEELARQLHSIETQATLVTISGYTGGWNDVSLAPFKTPGQPVDEERMQKERRGGSTPTAEAIESVTDDLAYADGKSILLVVTDGAANAPCIEQVEHAQAMGITVFAAAWSMPGQDRERSEKYDFGSRIDFIDSPADALTALIRYLNTLPR